jgi:hypothetical protein
MNQGFKISFQPLCRVAQFLTLAMLILIPIQIIIFVIAPPPFYPLMPRKTHNCSLGINSWIDWYCLLLSV